MAEHEVEGGYYSVLRSSSEATTRRRTELDAATIKSIRRFVSGDPLGVQFFTLARQERDRSDRKP